VIAPAVIAALRSARHIVVLTGSGISAESGIATFREAQTGLWAQFRPEELATPEAFAAAPGRVWEWYAWRRSLVQAAAPNAGHIALAHLETRVPRLTLVTQNVDGLHTRAGNSAVLELHGNILRTICSQDRHVVASWPEPSEPPPRCPTCEAYLRPDVVWFGEMLPMRELAAATEAAAACDLFLAVGTSGLVYPAAGLPRLALDRGATVIVVNPDETPLTGQAGVQHVRATAAVALPALLEAFTPTG
jgi:NAD-dependent deacetylase